MPASSIVTSLNKSISDISILENYINSCNGLEAKYQYLISEVVMLRLFSIVELTISEVAFKLACGAKYQNGNVPITLLKCNSIQNAHSNMISYNRNRPQTYLKWTKASFITDSIKHILDVNDAYGTNVRIHGNTINEMRIVRNHIAHRSVSTKAEYLQLIRTQYGGNLNLTMGAYLISTQRSPIAKIIYYIGAAKIIINDITKGY